MKNILLELPNIDFKKGFIECTGISQRDLPGKRHSDFLDRFNSFENEEQSSSCGVEITENTLRNWLYRKSPKDVIPRWDMVFKLCRYCHRSLSNVLGIHLEKYDEASLTGLSEDALNLLKSYGRRDFYKSGDLVDSLPRYGLLVNYLLTNDLIQNTFISHMEEYEDILVKLEEIVNSDEESTNAALMISELHKKRIIRSLQPDIMNIIHGFAFEIKCGNKFSNFDTGPIYISEYDVIPNEAFKIGLTLAIYHWQNPGHEGFGARVFLDHPYMCLPSVNIRQFCQALNQCIEEHFPKSKAVSYATVHGWLSGKFIPKVEYLKILCVFFSCDIDYLFGGQAFPRRELDAICHQTGLTNVFFYFFHNLPEPVREKMDYLIMCDALYAMAIYMPLSENWNF